LGAGEIMENKLDKLDLFVKSILITIAIFIAYIFGYPSGTRLIVIGIMVIVFGFWWKWKIYWFYRSSAYLEEIVALMEEKLVKNQELTSREKIAFKDLNLGLWMWRMYSKLGVTIIAIGFILLIAQ
jgi:type VI protein secretion system component VasK